jgi:hypothetical protein
LVHGHGEPKPSREREVGRMLGPEDAVDAVRLQHELYRRCDGFGC